MRRICLAMLALGAIVPIARAQDSIQWLTEPKQAVEQAKRSKRLLMVYVLAGSRDRDQDIERDQKRAMADPRVVKLARRFVAVRMSRSAHRDLLDQFGMPANSNMIIGFVTPAGERIDVLSADGIAKADSFAQKMTLVLKSYRQRLYEKDIKPVLENKDAKPDELKEALKTIREFDILEADAGVVALLGGQNLPPAIAKDALATLSDLSTKAATDKLVQLALTGDSGAAEALTKCQPIAAEYMLDALKPDDPNFAYPVYAAIGKVCKLREMKETRYFEKASEDLKKKEIERVRGLVGKAVERWKKDNEDR